MNAVTKSPEIAFLVKRPSTGSGRPEPVEGRISLFARDSRDLRERRDGYGGLKADVFGSSNSALRTQNSELRFPPVAGVLLAR
jgi:hypothetical protein